MFREAEEILIDCFAKQNRELGENAEETLNTMQNLANCYGARGKYVEAETLNKKCLEIKKKLSNVIYNNHGKFFCYVLESNKELP
jgi:Tfp pilus assembly protein PilF